MSNEIERLVILQVRVSVLGHTAGEIEEAIEETMSDILHCAGNFRVSIDAVSHENDEYHTTLTAVK